jgi:hypothetical protein
MLLAAINLKKLASLIFFMDIKDNFIKKYFLLDKENLCIYKK